MWWEHTQNTIKHCDGKYLPHLRCITQWEAILRRPGSSWGIGALLKGLTSVVVLKVERALVIHSPHQQSLPDLGIEPATFGLQVQLSNH